MHIRSAPVYANLPDDNTECINTFSLKQDPVSSYYYYYAISKKCSKFKHKSSIEIR